MEMVVKEPVPTESLPDQEYTEPTSPSVPVISYVIFGSSADHGLHFMKFSNLTT